MREIKFRGKRVDNGEWVYGSLRIYHKDGAKIFANDHLIGYGLSTVEGFGEIVDPATVGQYTGLKDKNGVEIYGGDFILMGYQPNVGKTFLVDWMQDRWVLLDENQQVRNHSVAVSGLDRHKVIGSIHE